MLWPSWRWVLLIVQPPTFVRWHKLGLKRYWRWKLRSKNSGRPKIEAASDYVEAIAAPGTYAPTEKGRCGDVCQLSPNVLLIPNTIVSPGVWLPAPSKRPERSESFSIPEIVKSSSAAEKPYPTSP